MSDPLLEQVRASGKYADLADDVVLEALAWARRRAQRDQDVLKRARRKLHQVFGAFLDGPGRKRALALLQRAAGEGDDAAWRERLTEAMAAHASTSERLPELPALWEGVARLAGAPGSVLDLGCGLGPLMLPSSGLPAETRWLGVDIDRRVCAAVEGALRARHPRVEVLAADARTVPLGERFDLALMLKLVPTLDQLEPGAGMALLARVPAEVVAVSFPSRSLGGRSVGMVEHYAAVAEALLRGRERLGVVELRSERVYLARLG